MTGLFPIIRRKRRPLIDPDSNESAVPQFQQSGPPDYDKPIRDRVAAENKAAIAERNKRLLAAQRNGVKLPIGTLIHNISPEARAAAESANGELPSTPVIPPATEETTPAGAPLPDAGSDLPATPPTIPPSDPSASPAGTAAPVVGNPPSLGQVANGKGRQAAPVAPAKKKNAKPKSAAPTAPKKRQPTAVAK